MKFWQLSIAASIMMVSFAIPQAHACTIALNQSTHYYYSMTPIAVVPKNMVQIKIRLDDQQIINLHGTAQREPKKYSYTSVFKIDDKGKERRISLKTPALSSCDDIVRPNAGDYYVIGVYVKGAKGETLYIDQGPLFVHYAYSIDNEKEYLKREKALKLDGNL